MPERDTYQCIRRLAENPEDTAAWIAFDGLRRRVETSLYWDALVHSHTLKYTDLSELVHHSIGASVSTPKPKKALADELSNMNKQDRNNLFAALCASVGVKVDPSKFK